MTEHNDTDQLLQTECISETTGFEPAPASSDQETLLPQQPLSETDVADIMQSSPSVHHSQLAAGDQTSTLAGYEILGELGRGGMGVVYKARQPGLNRLVALKMILAGARAGEHSIARFRTEAATIAGLQHPNFVQIYEIGEAEGNPFFSLELVEGSALDDQLQGTPQHPRQAAKLVETLARAMHVAHQNGIIHRDLKPANVLMTKDGVPKITDFGLAKQLDDDTARTHEGEIMGTPSYMAPEQAQGRIKEIGPAADVYALGAILYECLTGRPPFRSADAMSTILEVIHEEPVAPRQLQPKLPRDLETICLKCLQKSPEKRYADAEALADDLRRFLDNQPIVARPTPLWERGLKWVRRRPMVAAVLALFAMMGIGLVSAILWHNTDLRQAVDAAVAREEQARARERQTVKRHELAQLRLEGEGDLDAAKAAFAAKDWHSAQLTLTQILATMGKTPELADLERDARELLRQVQKELARKDSERQANERWQAFRKHYDDVLFHETSFTDLDLDANLQATADAARQGLALYGLGGENDAVFDETAVGPVDRAEVVEDCYELLLILSDTIARAPAADSPEQKRTAALQALSVLDQTQQFDLKTRAYHLRRARYLLDAGRNREHVEELQAAARVQPSTALDLFLIGSEAYKQDRLAVAIPSFERALEVRPSHFWARYYLSICYLRTDRSGEAKALLTSLLGQRDFTWLYLLRGLANGELKSYDDAEKDYQRALNHKPDATTRYGVLVNRGAMRIRQQRFADAERDLQQAVKLRPQDIQARVNLAKALEAQGQNVAALRELDHAVELRPRSSPLYRARARLKRDLGRPDGALQDIREALDETGSDKEKARDQVELARLLLAQRDYAKALKACDKALDLQPMLSAPHRWRGEALVGLGRYEEAIDAFTEHLRHGRKLASVYQSRGLARARLKDYANALDDLTLALEIGPSAERRAARGWTYLAADAAKLAMHDFDEAIRLDPKNADAHTGRGHAKARLGNAR